MEQYGVFIGAVLLLAVVATAIFLALEAERGIGRFREEHHEQFLGRREP